MENTKGSNIILDIIANLAAVVAVVSAVALS